MAGAVLFVGGDDAAAAVTAGLQRQDTEFRRAAGLTEAIAQHRASPPDLVMVDLTFLADDAGGHAARDFIEQLRELDPSSVVVALAGGVPGGQAQALQVGADLTILDLRSRQELELVLERAADLRQLRCEVSHYRQRGQPSSLELLGESRVIRKVQKTIARITGMGGAALPPVLILGETGTGKGLVARMLHDGSQRRDRPFIDLNCAALPESLVEAELFGHERGAFTDARTPRPGLFEAANRGTLFLDEIGDVSLSVQAKLLKVLEDQEVRRLGGSRARRVDVRVLAATNAAIKQKVADGLFRKDLYYRLNVLKIQLPPLRERGEDVLLLAQHFLDLHARKYGRTGLWLSQGYRAALLSHAWPGNVRELSNVIERAVLSAEDATAISSPGVDTEAGNTPLSFDQDGGLSGIDLPPGGISLEEVEKELLRQALAMCQGNVSQAAEKLGITRERMRYRLRRHRLV